MRGHSRFDHDQIFLKDRCANFKAKEDDAGGAGDASGGSGSAAVTSPTTQRTPVDEDSICCVGCGYKFSEHFKEGLQKLPPGSLWNRDIHMKKHQLVTHGKLRFVNELEGDSKECEFVTVAHDAAPNGVLSFMANQWSLEEAGRPNLIVSVLAGHEASRLTPFQRERIREGLVKAVSTTDSWIITGGTHVGLTKVVGEAVRQAEYREWVGEQHSSVKCIGINTWGTIDNHQAMANWLKSDHHKGPRYEERDKEPYRYKVRQKTEVGQTPLNPNHSFFVLVDNGMRNEPNSEVDVRCGIEEILSKQGLPSKSDYRGHVAMGGNAGSRGAQRHREKKQIPLVVVVVGGNITSFRAIARSLENGIPVVLCEMGITTSASDIITQSLKVAVEKSDNEKWLTPEKESSIKKMVADAFFPGQPQEGDVEAELKHVIMNINTCIKKENLLTVYKVGKSGTQELDAAILHSLLQGDVAKNEDPLELAVTWNRDDVAASDILSNEMDISQRENMDKLMLRSIMECKTNFVKLFMECGFVMKDFLTAKRLELLYNYAAQSNEVLAWLLKKTVRTKNKSRRYTLKDVSRLLRSLTGTDTGSRDNAEGTQVDTITSEENGYTKTFDYPFVELCLWAILANRKQMALFFWAHAKEPIMLALIGSKLWSSLAHRLWPGEDVFEPEFEANSQEFQELAVGVIDVCYKTDHELAKRLVEQKSLIWRGKTRMDVAVLANCKFFLATACVQACVEGYWKGNLRCKVLNIVWCLVNPVAISGLDVVTAPDGEDEDNYTNNEHELDVMGTGVVANSQIPATEHETLLCNKDNFDNDRLEHVGDGMKLNNCGAENENLEVVFRVPQKHGVDANGRLNGGPRISFLQKAKIFYTAPVTKFITHSTAYIVFLLMYSWMVLNITSENKIHWMEILVVVLATSYAVEEIRQLSQPELVTEDATWSKKLKGYLASEWNIIDVIYLSMIFTAFGLSAIGSMREVSRILYGMVTLLLWLRVIRLYQAIGRLGPLWIMMRKMFKEMLIFITVLLVFLLGYGICTIALIFTQEQLKEKPLTDTLEFVVLIPSLQMFGELFLETLVENRQANGSDPDSNGTSSVFEQNEFQASLTVWLLAAYLLIGNVLILNLLIAIFGHIYEVVAENSTIEWKNEMFLLCQEYSDKPVLPPPLSIFETFYLFFTELCCKKDDENELSSTMLERLRIFESYCASSYRQEKEAHKTLEENIKILAEHADEEMEKINDMINVVDYLRQDLEPQDKKKGNKKKRGERERAAAAAPSATQTLSQSSVQDKSGAGGQNQGSSKTLQAKN
ncbi:transient receptor potential cation channel subfamily M member 2-like isoform X3 [Symsagittifera roscoffensis]|uniref:transient receptor potential cation channel subfamily M member 2-like isoform X3 n=1 Tax=Symsagittifera roscoffensis TaxID=84072 RepID=UPI00307BEAE8